MRELTKYLLMHKNTSVCSFTLNQRQEVCEMAVFRNAIPQLPLSVKQIFHFDGFIESESIKQRFHIEGLIEYESEYFFNINEEGMYKLEEWLMNRTIPVNRERIGLYLSRTTDRIKFMLENNACSLTDCYWIKRDTENLTWDDVKLFTLGKVDVLSVIEYNSMMGTKYSGINSTLGGQLEKYWYVHKNKTGMRLMLAKKTLRGDEILNAREILASKIYKSLGFDNYCEYRYIRDKNGEICGCKCKAFTDENLELITAYDLLEEYGLTQSDSIYEDIIRLATNYGADEKEVKRQMDIQTIVDYLITNRDRHQNNIGFLRNPDTLRIVKMAPIYDSGSSPYMEGELPESVEYTTINSLYKTETEMLQHISIPIKPLLDLIPSVNVYEEELNKLTHMREYRKEKLLKLYNTKLEYLKEKFHKS